ncbi:uncharacterized protein DEA37_0011549 [Paragonimus westermani]|uniref:Uncharacterized protein n=1 Tax=Paragonimus westermani TaxID=34504 RepID=A0A5J4NQJ2_9TREM|nr:uncharacterized protein DEA37_0011549 [Paragonimus westermani]
MDFPTSSCRATGRSSHQLISKISAIIHSSSIFGPRRITRSPTVKQNASWTPSNGRSSYLGGRGPPTKCYRSSSSNTVQLPTRHHSKAVHQPRFLWVASFVRSIARSFRRISQHKCPAQTYKTFSPVKKPTTHVTIDRTTTAGRKQPWVLVTERYRVTFRSVATYGNVIATSDALGTRTKVQRTTSTCCRWIFCWTRSQCRIQGPPQLRRPMSTSSPNFCPGARNTAIEDRIVRCSWTLGPSATENGHLEREVFVGEIPFSPKKRFNF